MPASRFTIFVLTLFCASLAMAAELPSATGSAPLQEMRTAPAAIRAAGAAVVRIRTRDEGMGTGFFVSAGNHLVTNAHVVGPDNCSREGCFLELDLNLEHGANYVAQEFFAVPVYSLPDTDITVLDLFAVENGKPAATQYIPAKALEFSPLGSAELQASELFTIGHPYGGLKRWNAAKTYRRAGEWCHSTHCVAEGASGSPVLDPEGRIAGLIHRAGDLGGETIDLSLVRHTALFSIAENFKKTIEGKLWKANEGRLKPFFSAPSTGVLKLSEDDLAGGFFEIGDRVLFVLHSRKMTSLEISAGDENEEINLLDVALEACQGELEDGAVVNDPDSHFEACQLGRLFIDCTEEGQKLDRCPSKKHQKAWRKAFLDVAEIAELNNNEHFLEWYLAAETEFATTTAAGNKKARSVLVEKLKTVDVPLLEQMAYFATVATTREDLKFSGGDTLELLASYDQIPFYAQYYEAIVDTIAVLTDKESPVTAVDLAPIFAKLLTDPKLPVSLKLNLEAYAFEQAARLKVPAQERVGQIGNPVRNAWKRYRAARHRGHERKLAPKLPTIGQSN